MKKESRFGLIGKSLSHSFSKSYFESKFAASGDTGLSYELIELVESDQIAHVLRKDFFGLNVTIPYKTTIISWLNQIDHEALEIGAVNTLVRTDRYSWKGFNTDVLGFRDDLLQWFGTETVPQNALVLGSGGASKAVVYALRQLGIDVRIVTRNDKGNIQYRELNASIIQDHTLIVNTTPVGQYPDVGTCPEIPYEFLTSAHWLYDLIYNPANTLFLTRGQQAGAKTNNGLGMLQRQAEHAWNIWKTYGTF